MGADEIKPTAQNGFEPMMQCVKYQTERTHRLLKFATLAAMLLATSFYAHAECRFRQAAERMHELAGGNRAAIEEVAQAVGLDPGDLGTNGTDQ